MRKKDTSMKILNTAYNCLSNYGYANVSLRNIAKEANVALSQLGYYYENKEKLFSAVINMMSEQYLSEISAIFSRKITIDDKLAMLSEYFQRLMTDNPRRLKIFIDFAAQSLWIPAFKQQLNELFANINKIIESGITLSINKDNLWTRGYSSADLSRLVFDLLLGTSVQTLIADGGSGSFELVNNMFQINIYTGK